MPTEAPPAAKIEAPKRGSFIQATKQAMVDKPPDPERDRSMQARSEESGKQLAKAQPGLATNPSTAPPPVAATPTAAPTTPSNPPTKIEDRILGVQSPVTEPPAVASQTTPVPDEIVGEKLGVKTQEHFKRQREAHEKKERELTEKLAQAEAKLTEVLSKPSVDKGEYEKAIAKATQAESLLKAAAIERDPEFITDLARRNSELESGLKSVMKPAKADEILKIVRMTDPDAREERITKAVEGLNPLQQVAVYTALSKHTENETWRTGKVNNAEAEWNAIQDRRAADAKAQHDGFESKRAELHKLSSSFMEKMDAFRVSAENPEAEVQNYRAFVQNFIDGKTDSRLTAATPALAAHGLFLQDKLVPALRKQIADKDALIASLSKASPVPGKGSGTTQTPAKSSSGQNLSFSERVNALRSGRINPNGE